MRCHGLTSTIRFSDVVMVMKGGRMEGRSRLRGILRRRRVTRMSMRVVTRKMRSGSLRGRVQEWGLGRVGGLGIKPAAVKAVRVDVGLCLLLGHHPRFFFWLESRGLFFPFLLSFFAISFPKTLSFLDIGQSRRDGKHLARGRQHRISYPLSMYTSLYRHHVTIDLSSFSFQVIP